MATPMQLARYRKAKARAVAILARGHFIQDPDTGLFEGSEPGSGSGEGGSSGGATSGDGGGKARTDPTSLPKVKAGDKVNGLVVLKEIPNVASISASMNDWEEFGIRSVPFSAFNDSGPPRNPDQRTKDLADEIKSSGEINPLIVVYEQRNLQDGPYILEGGHRFDALKLIGKTRFPALVVLDTDEVSGKTFTIKKGR